jgi:glycosyltransferase involved in cell wall biosynthesis
VHIPNGLDLSMWAPRAGDGSGDGGAPLILCAARFAPVKRHADLLAALAQLRDAGRNFRAVLAGDGPLLQEMRALSAQLGLGAMVHFPGRVSTDAMRALIDDAAIAVLTSASEGMPGALMEAMASGVAVVGTDVSGTDELVVDGDSGLLVPAYDPPALARALARLIDDPELRRRLGAGGRRRMEESFSLDAMLASKERLYRGAAERDRAL